MSLQMIPAVEESKCECHLPAGFICFDGQGFPKDDAGAEVSLVQAVRVGAIRDGIGYRIPYSGGTP